MSNIKIEFLVVRKSKLKKFTVQVYKRNLFLLRFLIEKELKDIRLKLVSFQEKGLIPNVKIITTKKLSYDATKSERTLIRNFLIARKSLTQTLQLLKLIQRQTFK